MYNFVLINNVYCFEIIKKLLLIISPHHTFLVLLVEKIIPVFIKKQHWNTKRLNKGCCVVLKLALK